MAEKVVIIGSGPAGWTAAIYCARANLDPLVIEGAPSQEMVPGGQLMFTTEVENYPGFPEGIDGQAMMADFRKQAERFDTRIRTHNVTAVDFSERPFKLTTSAGDVVEAESVIVATGARANWLGLENETRLAQNGGGVSACAVCDGALPCFRNKHLVVIGGGDSAIEEADFLTKFASKVTLVHRRDELRASQIMQKRILSNPKVEMAWNKTVDDILGDEFVSGVRLKDTVTGEMSDIECAGVFVAIGHTPNTSFLDGQLDLTEKNYLICPNGWRTETSIDGVFAAGDVMDEYYRQAITAAGTGCMAALEAERWLAANNIH